MATISNMQLLAQSVGIHGKQFDRWAECNAWKLKEDDRPRFDLEGPITNGGGFMGMGDGASATPKNLRKFLDKHRGEDIEININSPGGSVFDANKMVSDLMRHDGDIRIIVSGACFSAAVDFLTIPNAHRVMMPGSMVMIHNAWTMAVGDANALRKVIGRLDKMNDQCIMRLAKATELTEDELRKMCDAETWFNEAEALESGFVDDVYQVDEDEDEDDEDEDKESKSDDDSESEEEEEEEDDEEARLAVERASRAAACRVAAVI